ncbi:MAG: 23S rRNA (uracil(1939)-C(5))-methyltransferase RlmD [Erysipelotrichaceae bacterium]|nr:23S rRNA (uracil(1939)-C(5))-methyltransferase RlmD [Erysipelotrichaceae bacterium]MDY5251655.1 23S rRNA (uracil(1939)-C(5))-methyltransferase RlmD [Erysipelotrichaceae bacterium]
MEKIKIVKMGINGEGIGYLNDKIVFVDGALLDEEVKIKDLNPQKGYYKASLYEVCQPSPYRQKPMCNIYDRCQACVLMNYRYSKQLAYKQQMIKEAIIKYAQLDPRLVKACVPTKKLHYRNQLKLPLKTINHKLHSGMYQANSNHLIYLNHCLVHEPGLEEVRKFVMEVLNHYHCRDYNPKIEKGYRYLVIRGLNQRYQVTLVTGKNAVDPGIVEALSKNSKIISVYQNINTAKNNLDIMSNHFKLLAKQPYLDFTLAGLKLQLLPNSFFQLNYDQALNIYQDVIDMIDEDCRLLVEAYCGIGTMSLMAASKCQKIIAIENVENAIKNAKANAEKNQINNIKFVVNDAKAELKNIKEDIDVLIVDPPRTGLDEGMIKTIQSKLPRKIIYVSCNPSTLAKNLALLKADYQIKKIVPYDMFAQTPHVESITLLIKK